MSELLLQKLKEAWHLRREQKNDEAHEVWLSVWASLNLPLEAVDPAFWTKLLMKASPTEKSAIIECLLLKASFRRGHGNTKESDEWLSLVEKTARDLSLAFPWQYFSERGLSAYLKGDYTSALEYFLIAFAKTEGHKEKLACEINILLTRENLGMDNSAQERKLQATFASNDNKANVAIDQWFTYQLRRQFHQARFKECFETTLPSGASQSHYFIRWAEQLPYHTSHQIAESTEILEKSLVFKSYRFRTLQGVLHPNDDHPSRVADWADRLYLWTWRWLTQPEGFPLKRLLVLLPELKLASKASFSLEDQQMVRNAIWWLYLLDPSTGKKFLELSTSLTTPMGAESSLLELEKWVIRYFIALRDDENEMAQDFKSQIENHPLWESKELLFKSLLEGVQGEGENDSPLAPLVKGLRTLVSANKGTSSNKKVCLDLQKEQVVNLRSGNILRSDAAAKALEMLRVNHSVSFAALAQNVYGIVRYDSLVHDRKILNLLQKLKEILNPYFDIKTKNGKILIDGDWNTLERKQEALYTSLLRSQEEWSQFVFHKQSPPPARELVSSVKLNPVMTRRQVENVLQRSRSSVNRLLLDWHKKGLVLKKGSARATRYHFSESLLKKIETGEELYAFSN